MDNEEYIELDIDRLLAEAREELAAASEGGAKIDDEEKTAGIKMSEVAGSFKEAEENKDVSESEDYDEQVDVRESDDSKEDKETNPVDKKMRLKKRIIAAAVALCVMVGMYLTICYSHIPFIEKWRTIYIETAMTTNSHQWLATMFFPKSVIDEVMEKYWKNRKEQKHYTSKWEEEDIEIDDGSKDFYEKYWELDSVSFKSYVEKHPDIAKNNYKSLYIDNLDEKENIRTVDGDPVLIIDTDNNMMIVKVTGQGYQGKLAIVKDPSQVELAKSASLGSFGQEAGTFGEANDALIVVNASGFEDPKGKSFGAKVKGCLVIDGVDYGHPYAADWKFCGVKKNNMMCIGNYHDMNVSDFRWAVEFYPALIVDGVNVIEGTYGMGMQPRTAVGQTKNGDMLLLIVDGRQPGHSIGCTMQDCEEILERYHAYQAMNMDGGSSSVMWYDGSYITKSSSVTGIGRYMPDAIIVKRSQTVINAKPEE